MSSPKETDNPTAGPPGLAARKTAARLLAAVVDSHTSLDGLTDPDHGHPQFRALEPRDRALVRAILATALRFRRTIEALLARRLDRPLPANATALANILHVGAAQILFLDVPDSAAVDLAVEHAKSDPRTVRFSGVVNGVLRALVRVKERALPAALRETTEAPDWFAGQLTTDYGPETAQRILAMHRVEAPTDFTVKSEPQKWADLFGGIVLPTGSVRVERLDRAVTELPGFAEGEWWVQDAAAALPARLLGTIEGLGVADLCAAPGGKTAQLAAAGAQVTAIDSSRSRLARLRQNLDRLRLSAEVIEADAASWKPGRQFDAILLDAPCSSTGTMRRHPDVPWTKTPADIAKLADVQRRLIESAVDLLKPGGRLLFSNCSLAHQEGEALVEDLLTENPQLRLDPIMPGEMPGIDGFITPQGTLRTRPADMQLSSDRLSGLDGFFAARLRKV